MTIVIRLPKFCKYLLLYLEWFFVLGGFYFLVTLSDNVLVKQLTQYLWTITEIGWVALGMLIISSMFYVEIDSKYEQNKPENNLAQNGINNIRALGSWYRKIAHELVVIGGSPEEKNKTQQH